MYDCQQTREFLGLYLDNELDAVTTQRVADHLEQCASCHREFEIMRSLQETLAHSLRNTFHETVGLRASIEAATIRSRAVRFFDASLLRIPVWAISALAVLLVVLFAAYYLPRRQGRILANPLYQAAAEDHRNFSAQASAPDWIVSQTDIAEKANLLFNNKQHLPLSIARDFKLARARVCTLKGEKFLHLVYETPDGRIASLFVCRPAKMMPAGERTASLDGRTTQLTQVSDLNIVSVMDEDCLLIAIAQSDVVAKTALSSTLTAVSFNRFSRPVRY